MPADVLPENSAAPFDDEMDQTDGGTGAALDPVPGISLTTEQAAAAGMNDAQAGDSFTLKVTITDNLDGVKADIQPGSAVKDQPDESKPAISKKPKQALKSPSDMGFSYDEGFTTTPNLP